MIISYGFNHKRYAAQQVICPDVLSKNQQRAKFPICPGLLGELAERCEASSEHLPGLSGICSGILFGISTRMSGYLHPRQLATQFSVYRPYLLIGECARPCDSIAPWHLEFNSLVNQAGHQQLPEYLFGIARGISRAGEASSEHLSGIIWIGEPEAEYRPNVCITCTSIS